MKESTANKIAGGMFVVFILVLVFLVGLLSWGFIELIQWVTSQ